MALVMLPCDLPWWDQVQRQLSHLKNTRHTIELVDVMQQIYEICNVGLDPEEEETEQNLFVGFSNFLDNDLNGEERSHFFTETLPNIVRRALMLKEWKPGGGLHFSLQQESTCTELDYKFISSLVANCFFSTFPKRTEKTHPTLQDFNFTHFFRHLYTNHQKAKLKSILHYFDWLDSNDGLGGTVKILRQVMTSKEWLTIEDWLECNLPLCALQIRHEGRLERADPETLHICFATSRLGGSVLQGGNSQECISMSTIPELLPVMLSVEALEDNEVITVERVRHFSRIVDPKTRAFFEKIETPKEVNVCCIDADDYSTFPLSQYHEDNILRELNKCLLAFQQKQYLSTDLKYHRRRLSPIGESLSSTPPENTPNSKVFITQPSSNSTRSRSKSPMKNLEVKDSLAVNNMLNNRRGKFIVLGSSGECLPVKREKPMDQSASLYSSCNSSPDEFHSAVASLDGDSSDEEYHRRYSTELNTPERRQTFAQRLRDALKRETSSLSSSSNDSSYAVGISVTGSDIGDKDIKLKRGGSRGFMLQEESLDEDFLRNSLDHEKQWIDKFRNKQNAGIIRRDTDDSSKYSFSTEYSSELEEVYEQFSKWLHDPLLKSEDDEKRELDARDLAVIRFAGSLLKRTLSESFAGVPLTEGCANSADGPNSNGKTGDKKDRLMISTRSLSLELAKHRHRLAAQLLSQLAVKPKNGIRPISTGNWGCGSSKSGNVQLKVILQWLAASVAGAPALVYYTMNHVDLGKLDTLTRILMDRKWTVRDLVKETIRYGEQLLAGEAQVNETLFENLIGVERSL